jgi:hypothetical protein
VNHNQLVLLLAVLAMVAVLWSAFWLWVTWMAVRLLRWRYLEATAQRRAARRY